MPAPSHPRTAPSAWARRLRSGPGNGSEFLVAALYATQARAHGPFPALHLAGIVLALIAAAGTVAALALPAVPSTALSRG